MEVVRVLDFQNHQQKKIRVSIYGSDTQTNVDSLVQNFLNSDEDDLFLQVDF